MNASGLWNCGIPQGLVILEWNGFEILNQSLWLNKRVWLRFVNEISIGIDWKWYYENELSKLSLRYEMINLSPFEIIIWLILPVVIRSSQRLSHACVSINNSTLKLRMAHYISYSLLEIVYYLDNRSNSRANTWVNPRLLKRCVY